MFRPSVLNALEVEINVNEELRSGERVGWGGGGGLVPATEPLFNVNFLLSTRRVPISLDEIKLQSKIIRSSPRYLAVTHCRTTSEDDEILQEIDNPTKMAVFWFVAQ